MKQTLLSGVYIVSAKTLTKQAEIKVEDGDRNQLRHTTCLLLTQTHSDTHPRPDLYLKLSPNLGPNSIDLSGPRAAV